MNVSELVAGATRLRSAPDNANSSAKKLTDMKKIAAINSGELTTALIAPGNPDFARIASRSKLFMAADIIVSPMVAPNTMMMMTATVVVLSAGWAANRVMAAHPQSRRRQGVLYEKARFQQR